MTDALDVLEREVRSRWQDAQRAFDGPEGDDYDEGRMDALGHVLARIEEMRMLAFGAAAAKWGGGGLGCGGAPVVQRCLWPICAVFGHRVRTVQPSHSQCQRCGRIWLNRSYRLYIWGSEHAPREYWIDR